MNATLALPFHVGLIAVTLAFDVLNGLHDAANSIATIVSTRVLSPRYAVARVVTIETSAAVATATWWLAELF